MTTTMKKLSLIPLLGLCVAFTACDNYDEPNPAPQSNEQQDIYDPAAAVFTTAAEGTYDLKALNDAAQPIFIGTLATPGMAEQYTLDVEMKVAPAADAPAFDVPVTVTPIEGQKDTYNVNMAPDALQGVVYDRITKSPKERNLTFEVYLYAVNGKERVRLGQPDVPNYTFANPVLPFPPAFTLEDNYYLLGSINGWSVATAVKLNHAEGVSPYDDPVFTLLCQVDGTDGWWWKIVPESTYVTGNWSDADYSQFGPADNGDPALSGMLQPKKDGQDPGAGCLKVTGPYMLTVNVMEMTYEWTLAIDNLWTPGDANGWNHANSQMLYTTDHSNFEGYAHLAPGGFKFTSQPDWAGINYGNAGEDGKLSTDGGAGNLSVPANALYWCQVNISALTYQVTAVDTYGVIGDATPGGWDASTALTPSADFLTWEGDIGFADGGEFKFRANNGWDINLGGDKANLTPGGSNIKGPGAGTYHVVLRLGQLPYTCTLTKK